MNKIKIYEKEGQVWIDFNGNEVELQSLNVLNKMVDKSSQLIFTRGIMKTPNYKQEIYKVVEEDLIKDLKDYPLEVVQKMVDYQVEQGNEADINMFQNYLYGLKEEGGFNWDETEEGNDFWFSVLHEVQFDLFFEKYPKEQNTYKVKEDDLVGEIKEFPLEIVQKMVEKQVEQGNKPNIRVFQIGKESGFRWKNTEEGLDFWEDVITYKKFHLFFEKYPKETTKIKIGDKAYMMQNNKPIEVEVTKRTKEETIEGVKITYDVKINEIITALEIKEELLFKTKQELLNSL